MNIKKIVKGNNENFPSDVNFTNGLASTEMFDRTVVPNRVRRQAVSFYSGNTVSSLCGTLFSPKLH